MAYSTAFPPRQISEAGLYASGLSSSTGLGAGSSDSEGGGAIWQYRSTHTSSEIISTGFFRAANRIGLRVGDVLMNFPQSSQSSSKITWHPVITSSFQTTLTTGSTIGGFMDFTVGTAT